MKKVIHTDVFIAGAGPAGIAAACAAAEMGLRVHLAEKNAYPGGRATASAVGTICGLYLRSMQKAEFVMDGFPRKFADALMQMNNKLPVKFAEGLWFIPSYPDDFEKVARGFLDQPNISMLYETSVTGVQVHDRKITAVHCSAANENYEIHPACMIDCSGNGVVCAFLHHELISDEEYQASAIVFAVNGISNHDEFNLGFSLMKKIMNEIESGNIPEYYNLVSIVPYSIEGNTILMKLGLPWRAESEAEEIMEDKSHALVKEVFEFMQRHVTGFENSNLSWMARETGIRTGIRVKGKIVLSDEDVLHCHKDENEVARGAWAIEYWRPGNKRVEMTYFNAGDFYSIPAGCLASETIENFFFAGKLISAGEKAIASARVIGTCLATGYAAGTLAAFRAMNKPEKDAIHHVQKQMRG